MLGTLHVILVSIYSAAIITSEIAWPSGNAEPALYLANSIGLLTITLMFATALLAVNKDGALISLPTSARPMQVGVSQSVILQAGVPRRPAEAPGRVDSIERDEDAGLLATLRRLMEHDKAYR